MERYNANPVISNRSRVGTTFMQAYLICSRRVGLGWCQQQFCLFDANEVIQKGSETSKKRKFVIGDSENL